MGVKRTLPGQVGNPGLELMTAVPVSSTNTYTSTTFNANFLDNIGLQITFVGTMTGTLTVTCSIDNKNFIPLTFSPTLSQPAGSNLSYLISLNQIPYPYIQVAYTNASGSGTLTVFLAGRDLN